MSEIDELIQSKAYQDVSHPDHKQAVDRAAKAFERNYPDEPEDGGQPSAWQRPPRRDYDYIEGMMSEPAYSDPDHPGHKEAVAKVEKMYQGRYPEPQESDGYVDLAPYGMPGIKYRR